MKGRSWFVVSLVFVLVPASPDETWGQPAERTAPRDAHALYDGLPLAFEPNLGQAPGGVRYLSRRPGQTLYLRDDGAELALSAGEARPDGSPGPRHARFVRIRLGGSDPSPFAESPLPARSNYLLGADPSRWRTGVPTYRQVRYRDVYPGVDVLFYGNGAELEFDFVVHPGGRPEQIRMFFEGMDGLRIDRRGDLILELGRKQLVQRAPVIYQQLGAQRQRVEGSYLLVGESEVRFRTGRYDPAIPLVIDPVLSYSTYLGELNGFFSDIDVAVDAAGNAYVAGATASPEFPTENPLQAEPAGGIDAFVAKFNRVGSGLIYSTYLGGSGDDRARGIAVQPSGHVSVTGETASFDFPAVNALQGSNRGKLDAFVAKLTPDGRALAFSTYLGGGGDETARGIAVNRSGFVTLYGRTDSPNFPTRNALQRTLGGGFDAFVARFNPTGSVLIFATFLGGSADENPDPLGFDLAIDELSNAYVVGTTLSTDFPTVNAFQPVHAGGGRDAFVTKIDPVGSRLVYSTYIGGRGGDSGRGIAVDATGSAYITGASRSIDYPVLNAVQPEHAGGRFSDPPIADNYDAIITKLDQTGTRLVYSTYLGGSDADAGNAIAVDVSGSVHVVGTAVSTDFPTVRPVQATNRGGTDAIVARLDPGGTALIYSTYLGGSALDNRFETNFGIAVDPAGNAYVAGYTESTDFPVRSAMQLRAASAVVTKFEASPEVAVRLGEEGGATVFTLSLMSTSATARKVELKVWVDTPSGEPVPIGQTRIIDLPGSLAPLDVFRWPVSWSSGLTLGATLLDPVTGEIVSASSCGAVPCD